MTPPDDEGPLAWAKWLFRTDRADISLAREAIGGVLLVVGLGLLLVVVSGVTPPMVAVESGSMEPHLSAGDLVVVVDEQRFASEHAVEGTGVVTYQMAKRRGGYTNFGMPGDVIVFEANGQADSTTLHRSHLWVEKGENWYARADPAYVDGRSCEVIPNCPAPHAGFITKGDAGDRYDQVNGVSEPVRPSWIRGRGELRVPFLGHVRLKAEDVMARFD